jgi:hypothetical protein
VPLDGEGRARVDERGDRRSLAGRVADGAQGRSLGRVEVRLDGEPIADPGRDEGGLGRDDRRGGPGPGPGLVGRPRAREDLGAGLDLVEQLGQLGAGGERGESLADPEGHLRRPG